ncbi:hypothetical protein Lser_V15G11682 [Lactuca serriola]
MVMIGASNSHLSFVQKFERTIEMTLSGKRVAKIKVKCDGSVFHQCLKDRPVELPSLSPTTFQNCKTQEGEAGTVGCVHSWNYFHDGKDRVAKSQIIDIDEDKKSITFNIFEGDLMELYKTIVVTVGVERDGSDNVVTWTAEYEKLSPHVPDPDTLMDFYRKATEDIAAHCL